MVYAGDPDHCVYCRLASLERERDKLREERDAYARGDLAAPHIIERIARLEATLREVRGYVVDTDDHGGCDSSCPHWYGRNMLERIDDALDAARAPEKEELNDE